MLTNFGDSEMDPIIIICPHCSDPVVIAELNCCIFRHAIYRDSYEQIAPHTLKADCEALLATNKVYGCCKAFRVINKDGQYISEVCEYI